VTKAVEIDVSETEIVWFRVIGGAIDVEIIVAGA